MFLSHRLGKKFAFSDAVLYVAVSQIIHETVMSIYSDKLVHAQVVIHCQYSIAKKCTLEDMLAFKARRLLMMS